MISFSVPGGGVGPHIDQYDVFIIQGMGLSLIHISNIKGWYFTVGSMQTGVHTSKPPTYPTHQGSMFSVKL